MKIKFNDPNQELLKVFRVKGLYYSMNNISCRSHMIVERIRPNNGMNFVSIMMNPGKSSPKVDLGDGYFEAEPDKTQYQLMKLMLSVNINCMHVINLSDIREPSSKEFYKKIKDTKDAIKYSIFSDGRNDELERVFLNVDGVICAWGVSKNLAPLSDLALKALQRQKIYGIKKGEGSGYYHPLPRRNKLGWLNSMRYQILDRIKLDNQSCLSAY